MPSERKQHQIVEVLVLPDDAALDLILDHGLAGERRLEPDGRLDAGGRLARIAVAPAAVIKLGAAVAPRRLAHLREFLRACVAAIGMAARKQRFDDFTVARGAGELIDRLAIPADAEPVEPVEDGVDGGLRRALAVGVLDPQQHLAAAAAGIEPVEQRGARPADMQEAGGRGGEAGDDAHAARRVA